MPRRNLTVKEARAILANVPTSALFRQSDVNPAFQKADTYRMFIGACRETTERRNGEDERLGTIISSNILKDFGGYEDFNIPDAKLEMED